jgi:hypothetical protein
VFFDFAAAGTELGVVGLQPSDHASFRAAEPRFHSA